MKLVLPVDSAAERIVWQAGSCGRQAAPPLSSSDVSSSTGGSTRVDDGRFSRRRLDRWEALAIRDLRTGCDVDGTPLQVSASSVAFGVGGLFHVKPRAVLLGVDCDAQNC